MRLQEQSVKRKHFSKKMAVLSHLWKSTGGILKQSSVDKKAGQREWWLEDFLAIQQVREKPQAWRRLRVQHLCALLTQGAPWLPSVGTLPHLISRAWTFSQESKLTSFHTELPKTEGPQLMSPYL